MSQKRKQIELELLEEVERSILLPEKEKKFWAEKVSELPDAMIPIVVQTVREKNEKVDEYIDAALGEDPDKNYLSELKASVKRMTAEAFKIEEKFEDGNVDELLEQQLEDLS